MKKFISVVVAILIVISCISVVAMADANKVRVVISSDGRKVMLGDYGDVFDYSLTLDRQQLVDMAEKTDPENGGLYYARVLPEHEIMLWSDGTAVSAFDITDSLESYYLLQADGYMLVEDEYGKVVVKDGFVEGRFDDATYPTLVYDFEEQALRAEYTLSETYPDEAYPWDFLSLDEGFTEQEMFRALVLAREYSEEFNSVVYFWAWRFVEQPEEQQVRPTPTRRPEPTRRPDPTPTPAPTRRPDTTRRPNPTATVAPTKTPENNPRPTEGVVQGDGEVSHDPDPLPDNNSRPSEGATGNGQVSQDADPMPNNNERPTEAGTNENGSRPNEGSGQVSGDTSNSSNTGSEQASGTNNTGSGKVSNDPDPMPNNNNRPSESGTNENGSRPSENSSSNSSNTGSGQVSNDVDPFA